MRPISCYRIKGCSVGTASHSGLSLAISVSSSNGVGFPEHGRERAEPIGVAEALPVKCRQDEAVHGLVWTGPNALEGVFEKRLVAVLLNAGAGDDDSATPRTRRPEAGGRRRTGRTLRAPPPSVRPPS